jgi:hypothetical protein
MGTLKEDLKKQSTWIVNAFAADEYKLDYTIHSFMEIDKFFQDNMKNGRPKRNGRLSTNTGAILFSISGYIAETFLKNIPGSVLLTDDNDPKGEFNFSVQVPNGNVCWPGQKVIKRMTNGFEDALYPYGFEFAKEYINESFDKEFWQIGKETETQSKAKPWWKFW